MMIIIIVEQNTQTETEGPAREGGRDGRNHFHLGGNFRSSVPPAGCVGLAGWLAAPLNALKVLSILSSLLCLLRIVAVVIIIIVTATMITDGGGGKA